MDSQLLLRAVAASLMAALIAGAFLFADGARGQDPRADPGVTPAVPEVTETGPVRDYIITSGALHEGSLSGCAGETCTIGNATVAISETFFIGLAVEIPSPPSLSDYMQDQIVLRDGSVQPGRMVGISDHSVVTDRASYARADVAWLYLFPRQEETAQPDGFGAPEDNPTEEQAPIGEPPGPEGTADFDPAGAPAGEPEIGALWTGSITFEWNDHVDDGIIHSAATIDDLKLREHIYPLLAWDGQAMRRIGSSIHLVVEDSTMADNMLITAPGACSQSGSGVGTLDGPEDSSGSVIWRKFGEEDTTPAIGWNIPAGPGMYVLTIAPATGPTRDTYPTSGCEPMDQGHNGIVIGNYPTPMEFINPFDPVVRTLQSAGGRMSGGYTHQEGTGTMRVSWNICREGVSCAGPAEDDGGDETAEDEICPDPRNETALLENALTRQRALSDQLARQIDELNRLSDQAAQWEGDFVQAVRDCGLWGVAQDLAGLLVGRLDVDELSAFAKFLDIVGNVQEGEMSWALPEVEYPDWLTVIESGANFANNIDTALDTAEPAQVLDDLRSCGAPTIDAVMDGATTYLRLLEEIGPLMDGAQETLNRLRDMDEEELLSRWNAFRTACLEHAACADLDPSICDQQPVR